MLGGPHGGSGRFEEDKNILPLPRIERRHLGSQILVICTPKQTLLPKRNTFLYNDDDDDDDDGFKVF
jgi:hypothetical protein